jgi:hypothetical protein
MRFDSVNLTGPTEYATRAGAKIDTLQIHHATSTSLSGLRALMAPGGRMVSANGAMSNDGHLQLVVPVDRRAFTSATPYDRRSFTVEVCNTSLAPNWGISDACHERLAQLAAEMHLELGMPLDRAHIIGHREVPGTYATACPGPSMNLDRIVGRAREIAEGDDMPSADDIANAILNRMVENPNNGQQVKLVDILRYNERSDAATAETILREMPGRLLAAPVARAGEFEDDGVTPKFTALGDWIGFTQKFVDYVAGKIDGIELDKPNLDEATLGKSIADSLAPVLTSSVRAFTDAQLEQIATAAADEADRRARERLIERNGDAPAGA